MKRIRFYADATKVGLPFINISEDIEEKAVMLIDTGSTDNILFGEVYQREKNKLKPIEGKYTVTGANMQTYEATKVAAIVSINGKQYLMTFLVHEDDKTGKALSEQMGFPIVGIIGTLFMAEHDWVIDFGKQEILIPDTDISVCELGNHDDKPKNDLRACSE